MAFSISLLYLLPLGFSIFLVAIGTGAQDPSGFISLTCGSPRETSFREKTTNIRYTSDAGFINTGVGSSIKPSLRTQSEQQTWYLRSFPQGNRSCYTLNLITGDRYLISTSFFHGGYDDKPSTQFDLHLGPNLWTRVSTTNETRQETFEMIHLLTTDRLQVCLVKTGDSTPFISALELRKLNSEAYNDTPNVSLQTFIRLDVGSISNKSLRYGADVYGADVFDRIWLPYNSENCSHISTNNSVDIKNIYKPPEAAMATACVPTDPDASMEMSLLGVPQNSKFYAVFHFAEIEELNSNDTREFSIFYNGRYIDTPVIPESFYTKSYFLAEEMGPNANGEYTISLERTGDSTMPPSLNALEVYLIKSLTQQTTETREVNAIVNIKSGYGLNKLNWEGDPCAPKDYVWDGVNCTYIYDKRPQIISLNLTASGLIGEILDSISNLTSLQVLDLSNNNLTGSVPEFLANMDTLKRINLSSNELNGSIPVSLLDKAKRGKVILSVEGNPGLCSSTSCATTTKKKKPIVVASIATTLVLMLIITATILIILKRKKRATPSHHDDSDNNNNQKTTRMFTYEDLANATDNFSNTNLIGQGGFGYVHRGLLPDGTEVAIKQLKAGSGQGEQEFQAEIHIITRVHHRNLLSMIGYCITGSQRLLVYEFVPNQNLEFHLHEKGGPVMEWPKRMKIALGVAKGLSYLHEDCNPKTIHRDVKAANILIDDSYEAKLADFGLARCSLDTDTHISTRIVGTYGYLAPEYASSGILTDKSDVFSFGVVLLKLITGRRPVDKSQASVDEYSVVDWAKPLMIQALHDGSFEGLVDPRLDNEFDISEMKRMVACAAASVHYSAKRRPKMSQIVRAFEGNLSLDDIIQGVTPEHSTIYCLDGSSGYSSTQYTNDLKKFKKIAFESQTFGSSGLTSDNGHYLSGSSTTTHNAIGQRTIHEIEPEKNTNETRASNRGFLV